jgi:3-hydroxyacyl-CoA dehydrogenase
MSKSPVTLTLDGDVAVINVNNPPVNTITAAVREGLFAAIAGVRAQSGIAAVVGVALRVGKRRAISR